MDDTDIIEGDQMRPLFSQPALLSGHYQLPNGQRISVFTRSQQKAIRMGIDADSDCPGHPLLFLDNVWPAAYALSDYLVKNPSIVQSKTTLELGAGAALPSCVASVLGSTVVVSTDYPAQGVIENIVDVFLENRVGNGIALGHIWGDSVNRVLDSIDNNNEGFDVILMADVLWKDTYHQHRSLLSTIARSLKKKPVSRDGSKSIALIALAHRPAANHSPEHDLEFFQVAENDFNLRCTLLESTFKYKDVYDYECETPLTDLKKTTFEILIYSMQFSD